MCITIIKRQRVTMVLLWLVILTGQVSYAQSRSTLIKPMKKNETIQNNFEILLYISGAWLGTSAFNMNQFVLSGYTKPYRFYLTDIDIGLNGYYVIGDISGFNLSAGYKNARYAGNQGYDRSEGIFVDWLSLDVNMSFWFFMFGLHSDIFLDYSAKNGKYTYDGIYEDCFNKYSLSWYLGMFLRFTRLQLDFRLGPYLHTTVDVNKIAQYNMTKVHADMFYYTLRVSYRLFTTGNRIKSPIDYF